jgi:hypothetical protein
MFQSRKYAFNCTKPTNFITHVFSEDAINKISAGALHVNMKRVTDPHAQFNPNEYLLKNGTSLLKIGLNL